MLPEERGAISRHAVLNQSRVGQELYNAEAMLRAQPVLQAAKCCCIEVQQQHPHTQDRQTDTHCSLTQAVPYIARGKEEEPQGA